MKSLSLRASLLAFQISLFFGVDSAWGATSDTHSLTLTSPASSSSGNSTATSLSSANSSASATLTNTAQFPSLTGVPPCGEYIFYYDHLNTVSYRRVLVLIHLFPAATTCFETAISDANCTSVIDINCFCVRSVYIISSFLPCI
jgi:hypothetical protein